MAGARSPPLASPLWQAAQRVTKSRQPAPVAEGAARIAGRAKIRAHRLEVSGIA
jgi:hypothetical protein